LKAQQREERLFPKEKKREPLSFKIMAKAYEDAVDANRRRKGDDQAQVQYWIDRFGKRDIETITTSEIEGALADLRHPLTQRSGRLKTGERRSYETIRAYHGVLHAILERGRKRQSAVDEPRVRHRDEESGSHFGPVSHARPRARPSRRFTGAISSDCIDRDAYWNATRGIAALDMGRY
jgi:hypothetical protein